MSADICLFLEGTYPYVTGGVSSWTHRLIESLPHLTFHIVTLVPKGALTKELYVLPKNVVRIDKVEIQQLRAGSRRMSHRACVETFSKLERSLMHLTTKGNLADMAKILELFKQSPKKLGEAVLMQSEEAFRMIVRMYSQQMGSACFLDFFWSWRALVGGLYSVLLGPLPEAKVYHCLCTGYAGLYLARARIEKEKPCLITEHGIYTNERRIEIASAQWIQEVHSLNLSIEKTSFDKDLKDLWMDTFSSYSRVCYQACDRVVTLHRGNQPLQLLDGASPEKMSIIPNGINLEKFCLNKEFPKVRRTVGLIGRVVPIKDIKTFIRSVGMLKKHIQDLKAYVIGPTEEDSSYFKECQELVQSLELQDTIEFTGKVRTEEFLHKIDVMVLTSISESQPLTILEAGAAGIPTVATNVGACYEILYGSAHESPRLGKGGLVAPLANPREIAFAMEKLLLNDDFYASCSQAIQKRVETYYDEKLQTQNYQNLYQEMM